MFPFSQGILVFQAAQPGSRTESRDQRRANLLQRDDTGVLAPGKQADIVAMAKTRTPTSQSPRRWTLS